MISCWIKYKTIKLRD